MVTSAKKVGVKQETERGKASFSALFVSKAHFFEPSDAVNGRYSERWR
jgi:hypothetical protein